MLSYIAKKIKGEDSLLANIKNGKHIGTKIQCLIKANKIIATLQFKHTILCSGYLDLPGVILKLDRAACCPNNLLAVYRNIRATYVYIYTMLLIQTVSHLKGPLH